MSEIILPRMLLIGGTGRNSGKTTFACGVIKKFSKDVPLVAVKISPHLHKVEFGGKSIVNENHLYIAEETKTGGGKDSSRMLAAGAAQSFFIVAIDNQLVIAIRKIIDIVGLEAFIVCESGGLRQWVTPGLFIIMQHKDQRDFKPGFRNLRSLADTLISFDGKQPDFDMDRIMIRDNCWKIKDSHDTL